MSTFNQLKKVVMSKLLLTSILTAKVMHEPDFKYFSNAPIDLAVIAVRDEEPDPQNFAIIVWSNSFPELHEGEEPPILDLTFRSERE